MQNAFTVIQAAKLLGVCERTLRDMMRKRIINFVRSGRYVRITDEQIQDFWNKSTVTSFDAEKFAKKTAKEYSAKSALDKRLKNIY